MKRHGSSVSSCIGRALCAILILACLCIPNFALTLSTATLTGRVTDSNAAAIAGAKVDANNIDTNLTFSTVTNGEGLFVIPNLSPGRYRIFVQKDGFQTIVKPNVILHVQDIISLSFSMQLGSITQSVTVEGGAPLIQKESATVGTVVDRQFVENLPLNGRSFQSLIALTPGVVLTKSTSGEQGQFSVNGQRANANYFTVDGVSANAGVSAGFSLVQSAGGALPAFGASGGTNSLVSVDAMQEFKIQTSTFAPEFGRTPGAQVSIVTRSGTNDFRGTLFDYFRNDALDANDWFANSRGLPKSALRQNDFGGVLGGPLYLPRFGGGGPSFYSGKNRTFFFFSYEGLRLRLPQTQVTLVPSVASRQAAVPQMQPFLNAYPVPNGRVFANGFAEFNASYSDPLNLNATSIRIDHTFNKKLTLFGRYNHAPSETTQRGVSDLNGSLNSLVKARFKTQTLTIRATQSFTPTISNEVGANYSKSEGATSFHIDEFGGAVPPPDSLVFPPFTTRQDAFLSFNIGGGRNLSIGKNVENTQRQINLVDNLSVATGTHQLKLGVDYRLLLPVSSPTTYDQTVNFSGLTGPRGALIGIARSVFVRATETVPLSFTNFSAYGQDTWKATPHATLTYGLRWDINPPPRGRNGKDLFTLDNLDNLAALRLAPQGTPLYETTYSNFAPRIGVAYQLSQSPGREMILRGGFGIFYDLGSGLVGNAASSFPYSRERGLRGVAFPLTEALAPPAPFSLDPVSGSVYVADHNLKLPRIYQWNLAVEQSLGSKQTFSASYIGANGRRLLRQINIFTPDSTFVSFTNNTATSDYHALQLQFQRRLSRGLQALASYTWTHSIDIASNDSFGGSTPSNPNLDRGNSDFDVRHSFNTAVTYDVPAPAFGAVAATVLRNWSVDTIITARSATPVDLIAGIDRPGGFQTLVRPDVVTGVPLYVDDPNVAGGRRFNRAAFAIPPAGRQGTLGRNVLRGFPVFQMDFSLRRQFNLTERAKLQLRAEAFNVFNHPNFGDPVNLQGNLLPGPLFGQSTLMLGRSLGSGGAAGGFNPLYQIGGPRSMQLALKFNF
jgi:Carboxypeptidase regulatory-like domain/TonB dependent receptor-like, beta-barrel/TonB-dependent Receptor Plug Domain